jgi:hypothetical protein
VGSCPASWLSMDAEQHKGRPEHPREGGSQAQHGRRHLGRAPVGDRSSHHHEGEAQVVADTMRMATDDPWPPGSGERPYAEQYGHGDAAPTGAGRTPSGRIRVVSPVVSRSGRPAGRCDDLRHGEEGVEMGEAPRTMIVSTGPSGRFESPVRSMGRGPPNEAGGTVPLPITRTGSNAPTVGVGDRRTTQHAVGGRQQEPTTTTSGRRMTRPRDRGAARRQAVGRSPAGDAA